VSGRSSVLRASLVKFKTTQCKQHINPIAEGVLFRHCKHRRCYLRHREELLPKLPEWLIRSPSKGARMSMSLAMAAAAAGHGGSGMHHSSSGVGGGGAAAARGRRVSQSGQLHRGSVGSQSHRGAGPRIPVPGASKAPPGRPLYPGIPTPKRTGPSPCEHVEEEARDWKR